MAAAEASTELTRLQWAALLDRFGVPARSLRLPAPDLVHFHAARDSLGDLAGTPWVSLARAAVVTGHLELFPDLHTTFWNAAKLCSYNKQNVDLAKAEELQQACAKISEMFAKAQAAAKK